MYMRCVFGYKSNFILELYSTRGPQSHIHEFIQNDNMSKRHSYKQIKKKKKTVTFNKISFNYAKYQIAIRGQWLV